MEVREIKFRAWDIKDKIMWYPTLISIGSLYRNELYSHPSKKFDHEKGNLISYGENGDHELMQYTGLKDKNGKEIYEGDILYRETRGWFDTNKIYKEKVIVKYKSDGFYGKGTSLRFFLTSKTPFYVIGNIYENPELLKDIDNGNN